MDVGVTYTLTMEGGKGASGLDQQEFTGENGVLKDGDGDVIATRRGPDKPMLIFKRSAYRKVSATGLEIKDKGVWKPVEIFRARKSDGHVVIYYGIVDNAGIYEGLGMAYKLENVPFDQYFDGDNGILKDGHGVPIESRWNGAAVAAKKPGRRPTGGIAAAAASSAAIQRAGQREGTRANSVKASAGASPGAEASFADDYP